LTSPGVAADNAVQAAYTLSKSLVEYFRDLTSNPKPYHHSLPSPDSATSSIFALLGTLYSSPLLNPTNQRILGEIITDLVSDVLHIIKDSCTTFVTCSLYNFTQPQDYRFLLSNAILALTRPVRPDSSLRQALLLRLLLELKAVRCSAAEGRVAMLARDEMLWYLQFMIEEFVAKTGKVGDLVSMQCERVVWDLFVQGREEGMTVGNWVVWRVCGLLGGIGVLKLDKIVEEDGICMDM
jgi:hypothetical protein